MQGGITGKYLISWLLLVLMGWTIWASPAQAQNSGKTDPLSRDITVSHYQTNPKTGVPRLIARWPWLNYGEFYRLMALAPAASLAPVETPGAANAIHDRFIVTETNPNGDVLTELVLEGTQVQITYFTYDDLYYDDVLSIGDRLRAWGEKNLKSPSDPHARTKLSWGEKSTPQHILTDDPSILNLASEALKKSPKIEGVERLRLTHDFTSADRLRLEMLEPDLPHRMDFDLYQIRATWITPQTRIYIDRYDILGQAIGQRALAQKYKSLGYGTPPKTY